MADVGTLEEEQERHAEEFKKWQDLHLPHPRDIFQPDQFHVVSRLDGLVRLLVDKGLIEGNEYQAYILHSVTEKMTEMRPDVTRLVRETQIAARRAGIGKLYGPNGEVLG